MTRSPSWTERRSHCVEKLTEAGYSVRDAQANSYRLMVASYRSLVAPSYLQADCHCAKRSSSRCLEGGRIAQLEVRQFDRPTCEQAFRGIISSSRLLYHFDGEPQTDRLDEYLGAERLRHDLVELLW